jgi:hypothetical protein
MSAGVRFMSDLPVAWRTDEDRRDLIHDARAAFVHATAVAHQMSDVRLQVKAELAVASCWIWVPSVPDVRRTLEHTDALLVEEIKNPQVTAGILELYKSVRTLRRPFEPEGELERSRISSPQRRDVRD